MADSTSTHTARAARGRALGAFGEDRAAEYLRAQGMVVVDRNWRCDLGELDLVLRDGSVLVVCEVKTRSSERFGHPLEAVDGRKASRLRRLAARWLAEHAVRPAEIRLDLVGVVAPPGCEARIEHVRGIG